MKKILIMLSCLLTISILACCNNEKENIDRDGNVVKIEFNYTDYMGGAERNLEFDFIENKVTVTNINPENEEYNSENVYELDPDKYQALFDELKNCGFFRLKESYYLKADDGGELEIVVTYEDGSVFKTLCVNTTIGIENEMYEAFYNLLGRNMKEL